MEVDVVAGSVALVGWDKDEVEITGVLGRGAKDIEIDRREGRVEIEVDLRRGGSQGTADLQIRLPHKSRIQVETVSAGVDAADLAGSVEIETVSGSVAVEGRPRSVSVETVSGNVEIEGAESGIVAESVSGNIRLRGGRDVEAGTVSGRMFLQSHDALRSAELDSVSGRIEFEGPLPEGAELVVSTHNGSIDVTLPASVSARFKVTSFSGRIDNELGPQARRERFSPGRELEFKAGSGDARIRLESFSGSIHIAKE